MSSLLLMCSYVEHMPSETVRNALFCKTHLDKIQPFCSLFPFFFFSFELTQMHICTQIHSNNRMWVKSKLACMVRSGFPLYLLSLFAEASPTFEVGYWMQNNSYYQNCVFVFLLNCLCPIHLLSSAQTAFWQTALLCTDMSHSLGWLWSLKRH